MIVNVKRDPGMDEVGFIDLVRQTLHRGRGSSAEYAMQLVLKNVRNSDSVDLQLSDTAVSLHLPGSLPTTISTMLPIRSDEATARFAKKQRTLLVRGPASVPMPVWEHASGATCVRATACGLGRGTVEVRLPLPASASGSSHASATCYVLVSKWGLPATLADRGLASPGYTWCHVCPMMPSAVVTISIETAAWHWDCPDAVVTLGVLRRGEEPPFIEPGLEQLGVDFRVVSAEVVAATCCEAPGAASAPTSTSASAAASTAASAATAAADGGGSASSAVPSAGTPARQLRLVCLQPGDSSTHLPLFLVHPAGASSLCYLPLVRCLGPQRPVYAFDDSCLTDGGDFQLGSIAEVAAECIVLMSDALGLGGGAVAGASPAVVLGGWSYGGVVALEMARQLEARSLEMAREDDTSPASAAPRAVNTSLPSVHSVLMFDAPLGQTRGLGFHDHAIRGNPMKSEAIRGHQRPSEAIRGIEFHDPIAASDADGRSRTVSPRSDALVQVLCAQLAPRNADCT